MDSIEHNGVTYFHFTCLYDFSGNNHQPGMWADMWVQEEKDWYEIINDIDKQVYKETRGTSGKNYYAVLKARLDSFYNDKAKEAGSYLITLGGCWSYYIKDPKVAKAIDALPCHRFESNKALLNALMEENVQVDSVTKAIGLS